MNKVTTETIINWIKEQVENKQPVAPGLWVDSAAKLNVLLADEHNKLFEYQQKVAQMKLGYLQGQDKINVSEAKLRVEATDEYRLMHEQKAKIERIIEFIRIAKVQARMTMEEFKGN